MGKLKKMKPTDPTRYKPNISMTNEELSLWRKEQRIIRNWISAEKSRKKMLDRISDLENQVKTWQEKYEKILKLLRKHEPDYIDCHDSLPSTLMHSSFSYSNIEPYSLEEMKTSHEDKINDDELKHFIEHAFSDGLSF